MENRGSAEDVDDVVMDPSGDDIQEDDYAEEHSSDLPIMAMSTNPSGSSPDTSLALSTSSNMNAKNVRDVARAGSSIAGTKKLEHASPTEPTHVPSFGMGETLERPPVDSASNHDIAPGAFPARSSRMRATSGIHRSSISSYDPPGELTNGVPNSAGAHTSAQHDSGRMATGLGLYTVEAQRVLDGNGEGTVMVAEAQSLRTKWYQRRWIYVGLAYVFAIAVVVIVVLVVRQPSADSSPSLTSPTTVPIMGAPSTPNPTVSPATAAPITGGASTTPNPTAVLLIPNATTALPTRAPIARAAPTSKPTSLASVAIACKFLSIPNVTKCRSTFEFNPILSGDSTTGFTIPSEIGLLTQLTSLSFWSNSLNSTIPSEIGLLTQLTHLSFSTNKFTSTIPSEIGLLTKLTYLDFLMNMMNSAIPIEIGLLKNLTALSFYDNQFTSTIPSEIGLLTKMTILDFWDNMLNSTIPSAIGRLSKLSFLAFASNQLKGTIPSSLCSLPSLQTIYIDCVEITCASGCCTCV